MSEQRAKDSFPLGDLSCLGRFALESSSCGLHSVRIHFVVLVFGDPFDHLVYTRQHQEELAQQLLQHGAIFFRGFDIANPSHFDAVVNQGFQFDPLPYEGWIVCWT